MDTLYLFAMSAVKKDHRLCGFSTDIYFLTDLKVGSPPQDQVVRGASFSLAHREPLPSCCVLVCFSSHMTTVMFPAASRCPPITLDQSSPTMPHYLITTLKAPSPNTVMFTATGLSHQHEFRGNTIQVSINICRIHL